MAKPHRIVKKANHGKRPATPRPARRSVVWFAPDLAAEESSRGQERLILDFSEYDLNRVVADIEEIRRYNPQRFEMEQLTAICYEDPAAEHLRRLQGSWADNEFWVRGHMPGMPLMPGVIMCEAAAQLASYYSHSTS